MWKPNNSLFFCGEAHPWHGKGTKHSLRYEMISFDVWLMSNKTNQFSIWFGDIKKSAT
jgi:hypothetical protein